MFILSKNFTLCVDVVKTSIAIKNLLENAYKFSNKKVSFTLLLSNNRNIKKLNKVFRKKNKSTDILSFPLDKKIKISKNTYLGDIIISYNYLDKPRPQDLKYIGEPNKLEIG